MPRIYFVNENPSELLQSAFDALNGMDNIIVGWLTMVEITEKFTTPDKSCTFVLSYFDGAVFDYLRNLNMTIFGPQVILNCLRCNGRLPKVNFPVLSAALQDVVVSLTSFKEDTKEALSNKIIMMMGSVGKDLTVGTQILVTSSVGSKKFQVASKRGIPVVQRSWIDEIWDLSSNTDPIIGLDENLLDKHRVPSLFNLQICLSGMSFNEREEAKNIILKNGAQYYPDLTVGKCTHLVTKSARGKKFNYAEKWQIHTVSCKWLTDSIEKGYALDESNYKLEKERSLPGSTPNNNTQKSFDSAANEVSTITVAQINETTFYDDDEDEQLLNQLKCKIWSDCRIHFVGCMSDFVERWTDIITHNGGTVCLSQQDLLIEQPSHVIVGNLVTSQLVREEGVIYVSPNWLDLCLSEAQLVDTNDFIIKDNSLPQIDIETTQLPLTENWGSFTHYLNEAQPTKIDEEATVLDNSVDDASLGGIFSRCSFYLDPNLEQSDSVTASRLITDNGGSIKSNKEIASYHISLPIKDPLSDSINNGITLFYLQSCVNQHKLLPIDEDFMFRPFQKSPKTAVLNDCVLSFSGYQADERKLLKSFCLEMGAVVQDQMARRAVPVKNVLATTHLIISKIDKKKYPSSKLWNIPAVTKHWIGACLTANSKVDTDEYQLVDGGCNISFMTTATSASGQLNETCMTRADLSNEINEMVAPLQPISHNQQPMESLTPSAIINKHLQIRSSNKALDMSIGDGSPIVRTFRSRNAAAKRNIGDMINECMKTPERFYPVCPIETEFATPDLTRALKARLAIADSKKRESLCLDDSLTESNSAKLPLHGVVVYILKSVNTELLDLRKIIESMGGIFCWLYEPGKVTHAVCSLDDSNSDPRNDEELLVAAGDGKILVNVDWLKDCKAENCRLDEALYIVDINNLSQIGRSSISSRKRKPDNDMSFGEEETNTAKKIMVSQTSVNLDKNADERSVSWNYGSESMAMETNESDSSTPTKPIIAIVFSGLDHDTIDTYTRSAQQLGATVITGSSTTMADATHLVCTEPGRNTKYLSAIAAGKWCVHPSFIDQSVAAGRWLNERSFEWGGPETEQLMKASNKPVSKQDTILAEAARHRRELGGTAFRDWRVIIIDELGKVDKLVPIITSGGGTVIPWQTGLPAPSASDVTHILVNKSQNVPEELSTFPCYKTELISFFLMARNDDEMKRFIKKYAIATQSTKTTIRRPRK